MVARWEWGDSMTIFDLPGVAEVPSRPRRNIDKRVRDKNKRDAQTKICWRSKRW